MPAKKRPTTMPPMSPLTTVDTHDARVAGGARSALRGTRICGGTLEMPTRKLRASNVLKLGARACPRARKAAMMMLSLIHI